jgi:hypothetical protein
MFKLLLLGCVVASSAFAAHAAGAAPLKKPAKTRVASPAAAASPAESEPAALSPEHLAVAQRVVLGTVPCELGAQVKISAHQAWAGHFVLEHGRQRFVMAPVLTTTGALRLEDPSSGAVWLQLANKSMLMDQKQGRRLADVCMNADQMVVAEAMLRTPAPNLLEPLPTPSVVATEGSGPNQVVTATK